MQENQQNNKKDNLSSQPQNDSDNISPTSSWSPSPPKKQIISEEVLPETNTTQDDAQDAVWMPSFIPPQPKELKNSELQADELAASTANSEDSFSPNEEWTPQPPPTTTNIDIASLIGENETQETNNTDLGKNVEDFAATAIQSKTIKVNTQRESIGKTQLFHTNKAEKKLPNILTQTSKTLGEFVLRNFIKISLLLAYVSIVLYFYFTD